MKKITALMCSLLLGVATLLGAWTFPNTSVSNQNSSSRPTFKATDIVLIDNFQSDYKIVVPEKATLMEKYAAEELQLYLYKSTDCQLQIITDAGLAHDNTQKYLSVGKTSLLTAQTDIVVDYSVLGDTGVIISRKENTVYITGAAS